MTEISELKARYAAPRELAANGSVVKFAIDRLGALVGLVVLLPLLLVTAVLIKLDSPGPVLFTQLRHGRNGRVFRIYKFRTMTAAASRGPFVQATAGDVRITRLGSILRKTSIDELPQLLNVLFGEMSIVGPRPHPLALDHTYKDLVPRYMERYAVRPGLTGLAQVSGQRGETPNIEAMANRIVLDLAYIAKWSLWLDIRILLRSVAVIWRGI